MPIDLIHDPNIVPTTEAERFEPLEETQGFLVVAKLLQGVEY